MMILYTLLYLAFSQIVHLLHLHLYTTISPISKLFSHYHLTFGALAQPVAQLGLPVAWYQAVASTCFD